MVGSAGGTLVRIHARHHRGIQVFGQSLGEVDGKIVLLLRVNDFNRFEFIDQHAGVAHLTSAFGIERSLVEHNLVECLVFLFHLTVTQDGSFVFRIIIPDEFRFALLEHYPVACFYGSSIAGTLFLFLHLHVELFRVDCQTVLAQDEFGQVEREAEGVVERERIHTTDFLFTGSLGIFHGLVQQTDTGLQGAEEGFFLFLDDFFDECLLCLEFGIGITHGLNQDGQQAVHEGLFLSQEGISVADGTAQDASDDIPCFGI